MYVVINKKETSPLNNCEESMFLETMNFFLQLWHRQITSKNYKKEILSKF